MECQKLFFDDASFHRICGNGDLEIVIASSADCSLYIEVNEAVEAHWTFVLEEKARLNLLVWNESSSFKIKSEMKLKKDAYLKATYGEMSEGVVMMDNEIELQEEGAYADIHSACMVNDQKHYAISCIHQAPHTTGLMENYAIVYENGDYQMVDTGKIVKGAYGSESHQTSRVLTLHENQKAEVTPLLLIDENDVLASHATSMGTIDENQLYYLQTRGLTQQAALGLITIGYLMPVASVLDEEELKQQLTTKIEKKVGLA